MRKSLVVLGVVGAMMISGLWAQRGNARVDFDGKVIEIDYGTPSLQGRDMLSKLPVGQAWRMGMNAATMLKTEADLHFGDVAVAAGEYRLTARRATEDSWTLLIAKDDSMLEVPLSGNPVGDPVEVFTIKLEKKGPGEGRFSMAWGTMSVGTDFSVQ